MKTRFALVVSGFMLSGALWSCAPSTPSASSIPIGPTETLPLQIKLSLNTSVTLERRGLRLTLLEVRDSRCPVDAVCVRAGEVGIDLEIAKLGVVYVRQPVYTLFDANATSGPKSVNVEGYAVKLLEVTPYPGQNGSQAKTALLELTPERLPSAKK